MLKKIGIVIVVAIAVLLLYATTRPDTFHIERTASIKALPEQIFPHINDLHAWEAWSPYMKLDPAMKLTYGGAASGSDAMFEWEGNSAAGAGRVTIADATPPNKLDIKLDMIKPFAASNDVTFTLLTKGGVTDVTWVMDGRNAFIAKLMSVFIDMDKMVGSQFDEGLVNLKKVVERASEAAPAPDGASAVN